MIIVTGSLGSLMFPIWRAPKGQACDAGALQAFRNAVIAEIAFFSRMVYGMEEPHAVRAPHDAVAAADAPVPVHEHDAVRRLVGGADRADLHAGRVVALVAELGNEEGLFDAFLADVLDAVRVQIDLVRW